MMADEYEWNKEETVIRAQGETAVYRNPHNATVIRQRDPFGGDDQFVVIEPHALPVLIKRLQQHFAENRRGEEE